MPRERLTRTEPWVSPVRAAISGPVMPSTSRRISGSRYASGSERIASRAVRASAEACERCGVVSFGADAEFWSGGSSSSEMSGLE